MFRPNFLLAGLLPLLLAPLVAGCADDEVSTPRVTFESDIQAGAGRPAKDCGQSGVYLTIGSFGNLALGREDPNNPESPLKDPVRPIDDGAADQQGTVALTCSITASGEAFNVAASAQLTGATGGSVTITGVMKPGVANPNITMSLTRRGETFSDKNCEVRFDTLPGHAIASGRVWASITCPNAERPSAQQVCATSAQFRFENCAQ